MEMRVVILMDESGSMRCAVEERGHRTRTSILAPVAAGLFAGLGELDGVHVSLIGHSVGDVNGYSGMGSPVIRTECSSHRLGDRCCPVLLREYRTGDELLRVRPLWGDNRDGEAIRAVARDLLEEPGAEHRDLVIVSVSDGAPAATMLIDDVVTARGARADLVEALREVRSLGVHVFGFGFAECAGVVGDLKDGAGAVGALVDLVSSRLLEG